MTNEFWNSLSKFSVCLRCQSSKVISNFATSVSNSERVCQFRAPAVNLDLTSSNKLWTVEWKQCKENSNNFVNVFKLSNLVIEINSIVWNTYDDNEFHQALASPPWHSDVNHKNNQFIFQIIMIIFHALSCTKKFNTLSIFMYFATQRNIFTQYIYRL